MKIQALLYKDILIALKDRAGVAMLFLMPLFLVLIMTVIQDHTFQALNNTQIELFLLNLDQDTLGNLIERELEESKSFKIITEIDGRRPDSVEVRHAVARGQFKVGIIIPENASEHIENEIKLIVAKAFSGSKKNSSDIKNVSVSVYIDPVAQGSFRNAILGNVKEIAARVEKKMTIARIVAEVNKRIPTQKIDLEIGSIVKYNQQYATSDKSKIIPNSVQHNVPAWTLFSMFFIVISFAGNLVLERKEGSYFRLLSMPVTTLQIVTGKIIVYFIICSLQFALMLLMGIYVLPMFGIPSLEFGKNFLALFSMVFASSLSAIGYALLIGVISNTYQQATTFGSISVVILSAIGGIWVPVFAMPSIMQKISVISPLNWGINGFYMVFIRDGNFRDILPYFIPLMIFFIMSMVVSVLYYKLVTNKS